MIEYDPYLDKFFIPNIDGDPPSPRRAHAITLLGNQTFIFGGANRYNTLGDLYCKF